MTFTEYCEVIGCPVDELDFYDYQDMRAEFAQFSDDMRSGFGELPTVEAFRRALAVAKVAERRADLLADYRADIAYDVSQTELDIANNNKGLLR